MAYDKFANSRSNAAPSVVGKRRSRFDIGGTRRYTCNTGDLVPFYCEEVLPGDTFDIKTVSLTRLETSLHQTLDNSYLEIAFFYVPNRIIMDDWDKLLGANDDPWARTVQISTPQLYLARQGGSGDPAIVSPQSLLNHLMLPAGSYLSGVQWGSMDSDAKAASSVTALPLRSTFQIYNDWFRDESLDSIISFSKGNTNNYLDTGFTFNGSYFYPINNILKVNRFRDRFSSSLPAPQKGAPVSFSIGSSAPVLAGSSMTSLGNPLKFGFDNVSTSFGDYLLQVSPGIGGTDATVTADLQSNKGTYDAVTGNLPITNINAAATAKDITKTNLYVNLANATAITVNDLRLAIAAQVLSEQEARGGTRLTEVLFTQWNIKAPSLMLDRSEYLGGRRIPLQMLEVLQTAPGTNTVVGQEAGHGKTFDGSSGGFLKSFMFHGYIIGLAFIRTARSYSQGIDRKFFRTDKYSYFNPIFDNIGEVPVYAKELYIPTFSNSYLSTQWRTVFGYQEAWYEYKEGMNRDSGYMQTGINGTLDSWHYGDNYSGLPLLSFGWLKEDAGRVDRTLAVTSTAPTSFQWSIMINTIAYATRQMAKYSIPNSFGFGSK